MAQDIMKRVFVLLIALVCGFTIAVSGVPHLIKRTQPLVWYPTNAKVDEGLIYVTATYALRSPCDMVFYMFNLPDQLAQTKQEYPHLDDSKMTIYERTINKLYYNCRKTHEDVLTPIWNSDNDRTLVRYKRFIDPITISIIAVSLLVVGTAAVAAETSFVQIPRLQAELDITRNFMEDHHNITSIIEKLEAKTIEQLNKEATSLQQAILVGVDVSWAASAIYRKILQETNDLRHLISSSKRRGKVPLNVLARLLREPWL